VLLERAFVALERPRPPLADRALHARYPPLSAAISPLFRRISPPPPVSSEAKPPTPQLDLLDEDGSR